MLGQSDGDRRCLLAQFAAVFECEPHRIGMRHAARERLADGGVKLGGAVTLQQPQQGGRDGAEIVAALGGAQEQGLACRRRMMEVVGAAVAARGALVARPRPGHGWHPRSARPCRSCARWQASTLCAIDDAHLVRIGQHREQAPHLGVRDGIVVEVEADIGGLAGLHRHALDERIGVVRQRQQPGRLLGEGLADADGVLSGAAAIRRDAAAPVLGLGIEVVEIVDGAGREEVVAHIADGALDAALLVAARHRHRTRLDSDNVRRTRCRVG